MFLQDYWLRKSLIPVGPLKEPIAYLIKRIFATSGLDSRQYLSIYRFVFPELSNRLRICCLTPRPPYLS